MDSTAEDRAFWDSIKESTSREEFLAYLERHPNGEFAALAAIRADNILHALAALVAAQPKPYASAPLDLTCSAIPVLYASAAKALQDKASDAEVGELLAVYRRDADAGDRVAQSSLGTIHARGLGVRKDATEAARWFRRAAEQGYATAQFNLGTQCLKAEGVPRNAAEAALWFRRAAEQGHVLAQNALGVMYERGEGVAKDTAEAERWYESAAKQGNLDARANLRRLKAIW